MSNMAPARAELEADPESDETQAIYDICRVPRQHTWDWDDPNGGGSFEVAERHRKQIVQVRRVLTCRICTTTRTQLFWYKASGVFNRWDSIGTYKYDWPEGYRLPADGYTRDDIRAAAFDRLPIREARGAGDS